MSVYKIFCLQNGFIHNASDSLVGMPISLTFSLMSFRRILNFDWSVDGSCCTRTKYMNESVCIWARACAILCERETHTFEIRLKVASATKSDDRDNRFRSIQIGHTVVKELLAQYPTEICLKMQHHDNDNKTGQQQHQAPSTGVRVQKLHSITSKHTRSCTDYFVNYKWADLKGIWYVWITFGLFAVVVQCFLSFSRYSISPIWDVSVSFAFSAIKTKRPLNSMDRHQE